MEANGGREFALDLGDPASQALIEEARAIDPPAEIAEAWNLIIGFFANDPDTDLASAGEERLEQLREAGDQIGAYLADECGITASPLRRDRSSSTVEPWP